MDIGSQEMLSQGNDIYITQFLDFEGLHVTGIGEVDGSGAKREVFFIRGIATLTVLDKDKGKILCPKNR